MTRYFCHECQHEGTDFLVTPSPQCPRCQGSFVEELPEDDSIPSADDPRDFDPDDGMGGIPLAALLQGLGAGGAGAGAGPAPGRFTGGAFTFSIGPGGNIIASGNGGNQQQQQAPPPDLGQTLFRALGLAPPLRDPDSRGGQVGGTGGVDDPEEEELPRDGGEEREMNRNQVPIQNLAAFLGEAFGDPEPHPADDPSNNPFAEGGVDAPPTATNERRARSEPGAGGNADREEGRAGAGAEGGAQGGRGNPLNYLFSLMNSFGINGQILGANGFGLSGNAGDYVWGGEANFQNLLNDLMEQAAGRAGPVPATEEMIEKLPKVEVTEELLSHDTVKDCTICQDDFVVSDTLASLPCRHLFHPDCIIPWLKTSGTCPVCRYAMIPQPGQEGYVEPPRNGQNQPQPSQPEAAGGGGPTTNQGSTESSSSHSQQPQRPSNAWSRQSSSASIPSTARIPQVDNGSRLPGSWIFGGAGSGVEGDRMDIDEEEYAWTDADNDEVGEAGGEDKSPERMAAEAAERRVAREREDRDVRGEREGSQPAIEDVD
ncbi:hypothetical protein JCM3765_003727 [Sporobolomyces pararoseus]